MATYDTDIQWDVTNNKWRHASPLILVIGDVVPETGVPSDCTRVSWSCPKLKSGGNITFFNGGRAFHGIHQSTDLKWSRYRGELKV